MNDQPKQPGNDDDSNALESQASNNIQDQLSEAMSGWKRAMADYQNLKREMNEKTSDLVQYGNAKLFSELLPIFQALDQMYEHIPSEVQTQDWAQGLFQIRKQCEDFLTSQKVSKIETVGKVFDPNIHEAVGQDEDAKKGDHEIVKEVRAGFLLNGRVIMPAMVIINNKKS